MGVLIGVIILAAIGGLAYYFYQQHEKKVREDPELMRKRHQKMDMRYERASRRSDKIMQKTAPKGTEVERALKYEKAAAERKAEGRQEGTDD